jgi:hypothetical protein
METKLIDAFTVSMSGLIGGLWTGVLANAVGLEMPWFAQFGLCGLFGFLTWWGMERGDRRTAKAMDDLKGEVSGMRSDLKDGQETTNELLTKALFQNRQQ